jgi:hypothetical protein
MAALIVIHAVVGERQSLALLPVDELTYHVVAAVTVVARPSTSIAAKVAGIIIFIFIVSFIIYLFVGLLSDPPSPLFVETWGSVIATSLSGRSFFGSALLAIF